MHLSLPILKEACFLNITVPIPIQMRVFSRNAIPEAYRSLFNGKLRQGGKAFLKGGQNIMSHLRQHEATHTRAVCDTLKFTQCNNMEYTDLTSASP